MLGTTQIAEAFRGVVEQMRNEGTWIDKHGREPRGAGWDTRAESVNARNAFVAGLRDANAYHVSALWATQNKEIGNWESLTEERQNVAAAARENLAFWVKSTARPAEQLGQTLEAGAAGGLLDGLNFGFTQGSYSPTLWALWGQHSQEFARGTRGTAEATVWEGLPEHCVLREQEWPVLAELIEQGKVDNLHVNVIRRNSKTGMPERVGSYTVTTQEDFESLPAAPRTDSYIVRQQQQFVTQNIARSIQRNREGVQTSLDNFRRYWTKDDVPTTFMLSPVDGTGLGLDLSETPRNLSRAQTNASAQWSTTRERQGSADSLMAKLQALEAAQRRGSASSTAYAGSSNPTPLPHRDSTLSTASAGSFDGGGELTRVQAHTGRSPERPSKEKKDKKASSTLQWLAGTPSKPSKKRR
ncbi:hypothetical protein AB0M29_17935 [Streptomyces sp. NPDC051976]|uniref:hypothetical protein n=1 Tax=Streptomyces sp. NPDC051976 TaxID=3154947 RepID=UPI00342EEF0B